MADETTEAGPVLNEEQRALIERNRQRAILLKQQKQLKLSTRELNRDSEFKSSQGFKDSGGGFLIEENDRNETLPSTSQEDVCLESVECEDCSAVFMQSNLRTNFGVNVCNSCGRNREKYRLITRTDAKAVYLLKDCDLDLREPPLKCILKKNPNPMARGSMRLYLESQVEERAIQVFGSEDKLDEARNDRQTKRHVRERKQYQKKIKELRMAARSSLFKKQTTSHVHEYGEQAYNEEAEAYEKKCKTCGHLVSFEVM